MYKSQLNPKYLNGKCVSITEMITSASYILSGYPKLILAKEKHPCARVIQI